MKLKWIVRFFVFLFLLTGCTAKISPPQNPTLPVKPRVLNSPKPTVARLLTSTPSPVQTTEPTMDASLFKIMQTHAHFMLTEVPATLEARNVTCKDGFVLEQDLGILDISTDQWTVFTCSPVPENKEDLSKPGVVDYGTRYTKIISVDASQTWVIQHNTFDYSMIDRPNALMDPYRWTADGKYVYLSPHYYPGTSGGNALSYLRTPVMDLYRFNLETGKLELVLKNSQFSDLELSPDDQLLVYAERTEPNIIHVKNMENGQDVQVKLDPQIVASGVFVWNSDSTKVVFAAAYDEKSNSQQNAGFSTSIIVLTPEDMHLETILAKDARMFIPELNGCENKTWIDENTLCLKALEGEYRRNENLFSINIQSGYVIPISTPDQKTETTSTPVP